MKRISFLTIAGIAVTIACFVLICFDQRIWAASVGLLAYLMGAFAMKTGGAKWKAATHMITSLVFGYALCPPGGPYYMMTGMFCLSVVMGGRLLFFEHMGHRKMPWLGPVVFCAAILFYVMGNLIGGSGWPGWALPIPPIGLSGFMVLGTFQDLMHMNSSYIPEKFAADVGKKAPDFTLPDEDGNPVSLGDFRGRRHVLLIFVRGDWCPTCHIMLRSYEKNKERFAKKDIMLLAIGPDNVEVNKGMVLKLGLDYRLLADTKHETVKAYGMQLHPNYPMTKYAEGVPLPASFLVDIEGSVRYASNPRNAGEILNPETIIPVVESLKVAHA